MGKSIKTPMGKEIDNQRIYDESWGDWEDMKRYGPSNQWLRFLVERITRPVRSAGITRILDFGCGDGINTRHLAALFPAASVLGYDFSRTGITLASNKYASDRLFFAGPGEFSFSTEHVDFISCFDVLEHVEDWRDLLASFAVCSGRYILLSVPTGRMRPYEQGMGHLRNFQKGEIETCLHGLGWRAVEVYYAGFPFYSPLFRELYNITNAGQAEFTKHAYGPAKKALCNIIFYLFAFGSTRRRFGDYLVALFQKME